MILRFYGLTILRSYGFYIKEGKTKKSKTADIWGLAKYGLLLQIQIKPEGQDLVSCLPNWFVKR